VIGADRSSNLRAPVLLERGGKRMEMKLSLGGKCFQFASGSSSFHLPEAEIACDCSWRVSSLSLSQPTSCLGIFFYCLAEGGV